MIYWIAYCIVKLISKVFCPCTFYGQENLPQRGSFIIASNHLSNLDPMILGISCWRRFSYVAKESLFKNNFFSFVLHQVGAFPIKRDSADFRAIRETLKRLKAGCPIILFPEGTRRKEPQEKRVEAGIGLIAVKSQVPVIPAYIRGSEYVLPPGGRRLTRHAVTVVLGEPLVFKDGQAYPLIANQIMDKINELAKKSQI